MKKKIIKLILLNIICIFLLLDFLYAGNKRLAWIFLYGTIGSQQNWSEPLLDKINSSKNIRITNTSTTTDLNGNQVKFVFNPSTDNTFFQKCGNSGENFSVWTEDGSQQLSYWVENWSDSSATVWIKTDNIPAGQTKTYKIYCDPEKTGSGNNNPNVVFDLYDDFNNGLGGWRWYASVDVIEGTWYYGEKLSPFKRVGYSDMSKIFNYWGVSDGKVYFSVKQNFAVMLKNNTTLRGNYKVIVDFVNYSIKEDTLMSVRLFHTLDSNAEVGMEKGSYYYERFLRTTKNYSFYGRGVPTINNHIELSKMGHYVIANDVVSLDLNKYYGNSYDFSDYQVAIVVRPTNYHNIGGTYVAIDKIKVVKIIDSEPVVTFE